RSLDLEHLQPGSQDEAGQPHAPTGGLIEIGVGLRGRLDDLPAGGEDRHRQDVAAEGAIVVVVLAVDVAGDRPSHRDIRVPGVTGPKSPGGTRSCIRRCRLIPASTSTMPASRSTAWTPSSAVMSITWPPAFCAGSP